MYLVCVVESWVHCLSGWYPSQLHVPVRIDCQMNPYHWECGQNKPCCWLMMDGWGQKYDLSLSFHQRKHLQRSCIWCFQFVGTIVITQSVSIQHMLHKMGCQMIIKLPIKWEWKKKEKRNIHPLNCQYAWILVLVPALVLSCNTLHIAQG